MVAEDFLQDPKVPSWTCELQSDVDVVAKSEQSLRRWRTSSCRSEPGGQDVEINHRAMSRRFGPASPSNHKPRQGGRLQARRKCVGSVLVRFDVAPASQGPCLMS